MIKPAGITIDNADNIYLSSDHKLQKFTSSDKLIKCVGQRSSNEGEFRDPHGVTIHRNQVYVCERDNHRVQVFDLDLKFIRSIGSHGKGRGEYNRPLGVAFDTTENMYVAENANERVQMMNSSGHFIRVFGQDVSDLRSLCHFIWEVWSGEGRVVSSKMYHLLCRWVCTCV